MQYPLAVCFVLSVTACGRLGFDAPSGASEGAIDARTDDSGSLIDAPPGGATDASLGDASMMSSWSVFAPGPGAAGSLWAVTAFSPSDVWVGGAGAPLSHFNGTTWSSPPSATTEDVYMLWGASPTDVWVVGRACTVQRWNGAMWQPVAGPPCTVQTVFAVAGSASNDVWIAGVGGLLARWNGTGWTDHAQGMSIDLWSGWVQSPTDAYFVGTKGAIRRWTGTVAVEDIAQNITLASVWGTGTGEYWIVGAAGTILHKVGAGGWTTVTSPTTQFLYAVFGTGPLDVWAVGSAGTLLHYDGGTWTAVTAPTTVTLRAIARVPGGGLRIVGDSATVLAHP